MLSGWRFTRPVRFLTNSLGDARGIRSQGMKVLYMTDRQRIAQAIRRKGLDVPMRRMIVRGKQLHDAPRCDACRHLRDLDRV